LTFVTEGCGGVDMQSQANYKRYVIVAWWAAKLGVPEDALLDAINRVGNDVDAVEDYLRFRRARQGDH
jgi:hypothetical protein